MKDFLTAEIPYDQVLKEARDFAGPGLDEVHNLMLGVADSAPGTLSGHLNSLLVRKGKRIRSTFLFLLASTGKKLDLERTARVSAAIELVHLASLVHDDIIDGSDLRRNEKTAHQRWGNRMAVLLGDYTLARSMEMVWSDSDHRLPLSLSRASSRLIMAEVLEIDQAGNPDITLDQYFSVIEGKTAALLQACGECGAILAGFDDAMVKGGAELGKNFGIAFQIIDDLLDYGFGAENLDKRTFSDLKNGTFTLPVLLFFRDCGAADRDRMRELLAIRQQESAQEQIKRMLEAQGTFGKARDIAVARITACMPFLESLPDNEASRHLRKVCRLMTERSL
ncbi:MAG TPA: polyprenyl synthetase family protein [Fibrobacteria bacterium]|nr:polyprenyl synthetase family protein [Fibrobacteria bacterium]